MSASDSLTVVEYALPPFEDYTKVHACRCKSCQLCDKTRFWMPRFFFAGFIFPFCWISVIAIFAYSCIVVQHDFELPPLIDDELPTLLELEMVHKCVCKPKQMSPEKLEKKLVAEENEIQKNSCLLSNQTDVLPSSSRPSAAHVSQILASARADYIRTVEGDVIQWHTKVYRFHRNWALRAGASLVCYTIIILFLVLTLRSSTHI
ncbi:LAFA_0G04170g1_1 [Lachancea sp. 'fantastica']|nr:LAFA_0G04170g1_1 [Lachancea sp. 'fantastica']